MVTMADPSGLEKDKPKGTTDPLGLEKDKK